MRLNIGCDVGCAASIFSLTAWLHEVDACRVNAEALAGWLGAVTEHVALRWNKRL